MESNETEQPDAGVYDDWRWHVEGRFPKDRPPEQAYVHIGAFVAWLAGHAMIDADRLPDEEARAALEGLRARTAPLTSLQESTRGRLAEDFLTVEGRAFAGAYYAPEYGFPRDWQRTFGRSADTYDVPATWETYSQIEPVIDGRYREWIASGRPELIALPGFIGRLARWLDRSRGRYS